MGFFLERIKSVLDGIERAKINRNFDKIEASFNNVVDVVSNRAFEKVIDAARLNWLAPVDTFADLATTYPNTEEGWASMARDTGIVYRYNSHGEWKPAQEISAGPFNEMDHRLTTQLAHIETDLDGRGINVLKFGVKGDGETDDTQLLQSLIYDYDYIIIPIPPVKYRITDEIIVPSNKTIEFVGGNHWNPFENRDVWFQYDGDVDLNKAMFRVSTVQAALEPSVATSNVKFKGGCILDGNDRVGYGFYSAYAVNESSFEKITVIRTLTDGIRIEKSWYASFVDLTARDNQGNGITIGKNHWGGINGCKIDNLRAWGNGLRGDFTEANPEASYGVGLYLGSGCTARNVTSEGNYGAGLVYSTGNSGTLKVDTVYLENNGIKAKTEGKAHRNWGLIVLGKSNGRNSTIENLFLAQAVGNDKTQSIWLTGTKPAGNIVLKNISFGQYLKADWENYKLEGEIYYGISQYIEGCYPVYSNGRPNLNWNNIYVSNEGSDLNDGRTLETPFKTLSKAVEKLKSIYTLDTINVTGTIDVETLDLSNINRTIIFKSNNGQIINVEGNRKLEINNVTTNLEFHDFELISRVLLTNCNNVKFINCNLKTIDAGAAFCLDCVNTKTVVKDTSISGLNSSAVNKNGVRLTNSELSLINSSITDFTNNLPLKLFEMSKVHDNQTSAIYANVSVWGDSTGFIVNAEKILTPNGTITLNS